MALVASGAYVDVSGCTFSYGVTPTVLNLGEIEECDVNRKGTRIAKSGGNAPGDTHQKIVNQQRTVTFKGFDIAKFNAVPVGVEGTLTAIINDEHNNEGIGAQTLVLSNALIDGGQFTAKHNDYAEGTVTFTARWAFVTDAYVDPLVITPVTS